VKRIEVDARGLLCPLPVLRLAKAIDAEPDWDRATLVATDPDAEADVEAFCAARGFALGTKGQRDGELHFEIRRSP
jgi:tRNA 2-thiouridine synthesizing protein A